MGPAELTLTVRTDLVTAGQLLSEFSEVRCDLVDGKVRPMAPAGGEHGALASDLGSLLASYVRQKGLGRCFAAETGFLISRDPDTVIAPDCAFVRASRLKQLGLPQGYFPEAPALAVEVTSPGDTADEVESKARRWLAAGCEMVWVVYPRGRSVTVYRSLDEVKIVTGDAALEGEDVVPGFRVPVGELFSGLE
ncbi:MAG: Uma2 family endonuclease [Lacipirellulaceae bacterium]